MATTKKPDKDSEETQTRMTFGEHLDELRKRVLSAMYGGLFGVAICVYFMFDIFNFVVHPYHVVTLRHHLPDVLSTLKPQEAFFTFLSLAVKTGLLLTSPWIIFQLWKFVGAGLYKKERKIIYRYVGPSAVLFLLGVSFFFFLVLPLTLEFFFSFSAHAGGSQVNPNAWDRFIARFVEHAPIPVPPATSTATATGPEIQPNALMIPALDHDPPAPEPGQALIYFHTGEQRVKIMLFDQILIPMVVAQGAVIINTWRADDYLNFVAFTALIFGIAFELPMVMLVLAQIDIVRAQTFRSARKYAYFGIMIAAVIAAPSGDLMTLAFLFIPMIFLYEVGILAAAFVTRNRPKEED